MHGSPFYYNTPAHIVIPMLTDVGQTILKKKINKVKARIKKKRRLQGALFLPKLVFKKDKPHEWI